MFYRTICSGFGGRSLFAEAAGSYLDVKWITKPLAIVWGGVMKMNFGRTLHTASNQASIIDFEVGLAQRQCGLHSMIREKGAFIA